jgi:F0F1-type ATP synthase assembly protein I
MKKTISLVLLLVLGMLANTLAAENPVEEDPLVGANGASVPTLSQWGLIAMALLLVTAGAIVIVRRSRRVAT